jgi:hypothetical protein
VCVALAVVKDLLGSARQSLSSCSTLFQPFLPTAAPNRTLFHEDRKKTIRRLATGVPGRFSGLRFSPYGTAFLTDAIIVQRYVEIDGRLLRAMAVVKVRASGHSNEIRHFHIEDHGIRVGGPMTDYEGLLSGRPTARAPAQLT